MTKNLVIDNITIEGLRGFNNVQTITFEGLHALISGKVGTGKSSTLCAIEWALFGDIAHIKCSESRTQAEFVNANKIDQKAKVILRLKGNDGSYIIQREKHAKKRDSYLTFSTPSEKFEGDDAADMIYQIFGTFEDFHRATFLHQEAVRAILTENPEERDLALDRLFGLDRTREVMSVIPIATVRKEYEKLQNDKEKIEERIKGATQQAEIEMKRARNEALELDLTENELNFSSCTKKYKEIIKDSLTAADDCGVNKPSFSEPKAEEDISKGLKRIKEVIKSCRIQIASTSKIDELETAFKDISKVKEALDDALKEFGEVTKEYDKMIKEWGNLEQMEKNEQELHSKDKELKDERDIVDNSSRLVADAIEVLSKQELENCPVCDTKISTKNVLLRLKTRVSKTIENKISDIDNQRKNIRENLIKLLENKKAISKIIKELEEANKVKEAAEGSLSEMLQSKSKENEDLLKEAKSKIDALNKELEKAKKTISKKNEILQGIEDSADICRAILRVLEKEAEYEKIKDTFAEDDSQIEILKTQINEMSKLFSMLQSISDAIAKVQINLAREIIGKGEKKISSYYGELVAHPYYNSIRIDIEQRNVKGIQKNTYNIKAFNNKEGKETLISTRFSTGQMNCAALSIFLSLSSMLERKTKFVILDDPSQSLDTEHKESLVKVLKDMANENQLIIATQDMELEGDIEAKFIPDFKYVELKYENWGKDGPVIKISKKQK